MEKLTSTDIKWIRSLHDKSARKTEGCFIVEGRKLVTECLHQQRFELVMIVTDSNLPDEFEQLASCPIKSCSPKELQRISTFKNASFVLAVLRYPTLTAPITAKRLICLDNIQDPGNLGTIIRIADWFGIQDIVASEQTVDCFNSKTIQASMGSIFRVSVSYTNLSEFLKTSTLPIYGAMMDGTTIQEITMETDSILVIGNEANGMSPDLIPYLTQHISIPRFGGAESLNAAVACGILVAKWNRL
jgi:TrmH family RNA methyltransferase